MAKRVRPPRRTTSPRNNIDDLEEASGDGNSSWKAGLKGALYGLVFSIVAAVALSLATPLPENLPGVGAVRVVDNSRDSRGVGGEIAASSDASQGQSEGDPTQSETSASVEIESNDASQATAAPAQTGDSNGEGEAAQAQEPEVADATTTTTPSTDAGEGDPAATAENTDQPSETAPVSTETQSPTPVIDEAASTAETAETTELAALAPAEIGPPPEPVTISLSGPALTVNARAYDGPADAPLMAVVLANASAGAIAADALPLLTMPLTLSVVPESPSDRDFALAAREAQHEVLGQIPVQSAEAGGVAGQILTAMDAERISLEVNARMAVLDMAVGATLDGSAFGASDPALLSSMIGTIKQHGFAFVDARRAAGITDALPAEADGIDYASVDRAVPAGATSQQIYEILESSAYRAERDGTAIVVVDSSPEALQALLRWGLERDRRPVWFAPISAVIERRAAAN